MAGFVAPSCPLGWRPFKTKVALNYILHTFILIVATINISSFPHCRNWKRERGISVVWKMFKRKLHCSYKWSAWLFNFTDSRDSVALLISKSLLFPAFAGDVKASAAGVTQSSWNCPVAAFLLLLSCASPSQPGLRTLRRSQSVPTKWPSSAQHTR